MARDLGLNGIIHSARPGVVARSGHGFVYYGALDAIYVVIGSTSSQAQSVPDGLLRGLVPTLAPFMCCRSHRGGNSLRSGGRARYTSFPKFNLSHGEHLSD